METNWGKLFCKDDSFESCRASGWMFVIFSKSNPLFVIVFSLSIHLTYSSVALSADVALRAPCFFKCVPCLLQGRFQLLCGSEGKNTESVGQWGPLGIVDLALDFDGKLIRTG